MVNKVFRVGVVAPASPISVATADKVKALVDTLYGEDRLELIFHDQVFHSAGHFAGPDAARASAFLDMANDPGIDAVWFARGGYGSARILSSVLTELSPAAHVKTYLGYSDMGALLSGLMTAGVTGLAHGPMPGDINRRGGEEAVTRSLKWLVEGDESALEARFGTEPAAAFNLITFSQIVGTPWQADLSGRALLLEEVSEYLYRLDRSLFHITSNPDVQKVKGIAMGRVTDIPKNDRPFGETVEDIFARCCEAAGIPFLGSADIGHDKDNKIVPFGAPLVG